MTLVMPNFKPKVEATQSLLGEVYDRIDSAIDLIDCAYLATESSKINNSPGAALRAVLETAKNKAAEAKDRLHDTIAWAPS